MPWIGGLLKGFTRGAVDSEEVRRIHLLIAISVVGIGNLLPLGVLAYLERHPRLAAVDFLFAALLSLNLLHAKGRRRVEANVIFGLSCAAALYLFVFATGGVNSSGFVWYYTFPLIASSLLGARRGAAAAVALLAPAVAFFVWHPPPAVWASYSPDLKVRFIPSYLFVTALSYLFESTRERTRRDLQLARDVAERASRAKSDFLASMSHELRTPLNAVIGFSEVLEAGYFGELNPKQREYIGDIHQAGHHLLSLIAEVLDLAKIESGTMALETSCVDLGRLVEDSLVMVRERARSHGIVLTLQPPPPGGGPRPEVDVRRIKQVMYNLLSNAVKFTTGGGAVTVQVREVAGEAEVAVTDTGVGVAAADRDRIFEEFYQVRGGAADKTAGTGLGLALSRRILELHGGRIWVESEGPGKGSRFVFRLPIRSGDGR